VQRRTKVRQTPLPRPRPAGSQQRLKSTVVLKRYEQSDGSPALSHLERLASRNASEPATRMLSELAHTDPLDTGHVLHRSTQYGGRLLAQSGSFRQRLVSYWVTDPHFLQVAAFAALSCILANPVSGWGAMAAAGGHVCSVAVYLACGDLT
jgi:hypothetical protein